MYTPSPNWYQGVINKVKQFNKIPLFYAYIIAFEGRIKKGLEDCNKPGAPDTLCKGGSQFIRVFFLSK